MILPKFALRFGNFRTYNNIYDTYKEDSKNELIILEESYDDNDNKVSTEVARVTWGMDNGLIRFVTSFSTNIERLEEDKQNDFFDMTKTIYGIIQKEASTYKALQQENSKVWQDIKAWFGCTMDEFVSRPFQARLMKLWFYGKYRTPGSIKLARDIEQYGFVRPLCEYLQELEVPPIKE